MIRLAIAVAGLAALAACNSSPPPPAKPIDVRGAEQERLHQLDALNLAIALKRAIYDLGYTCQRVDKAGFVARYQNLDMWAVECNDGRHWAVFSAPDGSAQARDCKDLKGTGIPECTITKVPPGSFEPKAG